MKSRFATQRAYTRPGKINNTSGDFVCRDCGNFVSVDEALSGVGNRNHCPYCLASRHLDQFEAGDRLSACKASMRPVGLTFKRSANKYASCQAGELMIVHLCQDCGKVSINRIAADDDPVLLLALLAQSDDLDENTCVWLIRDGITLLSTAQSDQVRQGLYGKQIYRSSLP